MRNCRLRGFVELQGLSGRFISRLFISLHSASPRSAFGAASLTKTTITWIPIFGRRTSRHFARALFGGRARPTDARRRERTMGAAFAGTVGDLMAHPKRTDGLCK